MMRGCFLSFFLIFGAFFSFAADSLRTHIFIEGSGQTREQEKYFLDNFRLEAASLGFTPEADKANAGYTFKFNVIPNMVTYSDGTTEPAPPDEPQLIIQITLTRNSDGTELISFDRPFTDIDKMNEYNQYLFFQAVVVIPADSDDIQEAAAKDDMAKDDRVKIGKVKVDRAIDDDSWRNQLLYLRVSADLPITFYKLQPKGLFNENSVYTGDIDSPPWSAPVDNRAGALPGITLGLEYQFLNFMSVEAKAQARWEHLNNTDFISLSAGLDVKFPLKFIDNVIVAPYITASYPVPFSIQLTSGAAKIFDSFPLIGIGGGLQLGLKGGKTNAVFLDISYLYFIGDTGINNHYKHFGLSAKPDVIYFKRSVIGLSLGYKFGLLDRGRVKNKAAPLNAPAEDKSADFADAALTDEATFADTDTEPAPETAFSE